MGTNLGIIHFRVIALLLLAFLNSHAVIAADGPLTKLCKNKLTHALILSAAAHTLILDPPHFQRNGTPTPETNQNTQELTSEPEMYLNSNEEQLLNNFINEAPPSADLPSRQQLLARAEQGLKEMLSQGHTSVSLIELQIDSEAL